MGAAPVAKYPEGFLAIEVVAVDDCERLVDNILCHEHGVGSAPGFHPFGIDIVSGRDLVQFLGYEHEFQGLAVDGLDVAVLCLDMFFHVGLEVFAHNVYDFAESCFHCVVDGIVDYGFTVGAEAVHLFEPAVAAAHSGCEDKKCRFHDNLDN